MSAPRPSGSEPLVWAIDTRHLPLYWFPRDCPRGTFWADARTDPADAGAPARRRRAECTSSRRTGSSECAAPSVFAYRFPEAVLRAAPRGRRLLVSRTASSRWSGSCSATSSHLHAAGGDRASRPAESLAALERGRRLDPRVQRHAACATRSRSRSRPSNSLLQGQASGRFLATPGRRGKPGRRRAGLAQDEESRRRGLELAARVRTATRATASASADGPTQRIAAPPSATSGRHHSAATGGCASAFATATCNSLLLGSSARPQTTRRFGSSSVHRSRKFALRRSASSSVTSRCGSDAASGIPGVPPPLPTSTIGPSKRPRARAPRAHRRAGRAEPPRGPSARSAPASRPRPQASARAGQTATLRGKMTT